MALMFNNNRARKSYIETITQVISFLGLGLMSAVLFAGEANVLSAKITSLGDNKYRIDTSVKHEDTGWQHYANAWEVLDDKGTVIGTRVLLHPHVNEQPFTRSLTLVIPEKIKTVIIRAKDLVHGYGGKEYRLKVPK